MAGGYSICELWGRSLGLTPAVAMENSPAIIQDVLLQRSKDSAACLYDLRKTFCVISLRPPHVTRYAVQFLEGF